MNKLVEKAGPNRSLKVLLTETNRWALSARLAIALSEVGCEVAAICPARHALTKTSAVRRVLRYSALRPVESLASAIEAIDPDIIIPACDRSVTHLHELYRRVKNSGEAGNKTASLIERSLGAPTNYSIVSSRFALLETAQEEGVLIPDMRHFDSAEDMEAWSNRKAFPWVIKADGTWGGAGVRVVQSASQAKSSWKELAQITRLTRVVKRLAVNRDSFMLRSWWEHKGSELVMQSYVHGRPANCTVFAWKGKVIALIAVEVIRSEGVTGPASVVRIVDSDQMRFAAEKIASRLGMSGFFGLDFMIEQGSEAAYLIEMNPRLAPPCHLRLGKGRDLVGAFVGELTGKAVPDFPGTTECKVIAYYPQANGAEECLESDCYYDVPKDEPQLLNELMNPFPDRTFLFRLAQRMTRVPTTSAFFEGAVSTPDDHLKQPGIPQDLA